MTRVERQLLYAAIMERDEAIRLANWQGVPPEVTATKWGIGVTTVIKLGKGGR